MLLINTKLDKSIIHGIGCFAVDFIPQGTPIWKFTKGFDQEFDLNFPDKLSFPAREQFIKYTYLSKVTNKYIFCMDDARFFNHSDDNNVVNVVVKGEQEGIDYAARDIQAGEELLYDYKVFGFDAYSSFLNGCDNV